MCGTNHLPGHKKKQNTTILSLPPQIMDMLRGYLSDKIEHITSSLHSHILLWAGKLAHFPNNPKQMKCNGYCHCRNTYYGVETLIHSEDEKLPRRIVHCYNKASTTTTTTTTTKSEPYYLPPLSKLMWSSSPPAVRSIVLGDLIGTDSGDYMSSDLAEEQVEDSKIEVQTQSQSRFGRRETRSERKRELPPLITLMRQTGRMPWSFKKEYNKYGRLIIHAERVTHREYVEAHQENCRLTMKLVDDDNDIDEIENKTDYCEECGWPMDEDECLDGDEEESDFEFEQEVEKESNLENESRRCMDLRECVSYANSD